MLAFLVDPATYDIFDGGLKDQAVLAIALLELKGYNPVIKITRESVR